MARVQVFYKGRRKRRNYLFIPFVILLAIISLGMVTFYGLQKYAVINKDSVSIELPILADKNAVFDSQGHEIKSFDPVNVSVVLEEPDYSGIEAVAGEKVKPMRAIFVPYTDLNHDKLQEYVGRLNQGNALLLEMKPRSGQLMWESQAEMAVNYGISVPSETTAAVRDFLAEMEEKDIYLAAQISCCIDNLLPTRTSAYTIKNEVGMNYQDEKGLWLDAYNEAVRKYAAQMAQELFDMGFDEVVLADVAHPTLTEPVTLLYTNEISSQRDTSLAVCGFAVSVARQLQDRESGALSIYCDTRPGLVKPDLTTGQDARLFMKLYDRVYLKTDKSAYPYNVEDIQSNVTIGSVYDRLMPVVENYIPSDNSSWVLIDVPEEEE
ncbi:MAG: putative glycoside hydrolase [Candidatus Limivicinus sp.]|nr:putative glycoside hydrolase [Candidatus Limivicinus sp.]MDY5564992.1 putative glycoside hydrolase [Candidatus Limivicinus sp.]